MALSASAWISGVVCLGLGIVIGTQLEEVQPSQAAPPTTLQVMPSHDADSRHLQAWGEQYEAVLTRAVREEIALQLQDFKTQALSSGESGQGERRPVSDTPVAQQDETFYQASSLMDEAIAVGELDAASARALVDYLHRLPVEQQTALRAKQVDAFNRGLISSPLSPEEIMAQGM